MDSLDREWEKVFIAFDVLDAAFENLIKIGEEAINANKNKDQK